MKLTSVEITRLKWIEKKEAEVLKKFKNPNIVSSCSKDGIMHSEVVEYDKKNVDFNKKIKK